jgi:hypothetical protein
MAVAAVTLDEIRRKHEQLFKWAEQEFQERCQREGMGDAMEAALLMEAILTALTAIHMGEIPA